MKDELRVVKSEIFAEVRFTDICMCKLAFIRGPSSEAGMKVK